MATQMKMVLTFPFSGKNHLNEIIIKEMWFSVTVFGIDIA